MSCLGPKRFCQQFVLPEVEIAFDNYLYCLWVGTGYIHNDVLPVGQEVGQVAVVAVQEVEKVIKELGEHIANPAAGATGGDKDAFKNYFLKVQKSIPKPATYVEL